MTAYEAACPACGATVRFVLASSMLRVCDYCGVALVRQGADLKSYGRVAEILKTDSALRLGAEGRFSGAPHFTLVGRFQLDYGAGAWDEWLMAFEGGSFAWLTEAQGHFYYLREVPLPPAPHFEGLKAGTALDLGPPGVFVVAEVRSARFMTAEGELPSPVAPGSLLHYADLSGRKGEFGTLDYGTGSTPEALYVGEEVTLEEMGLGAFVKDKDAAEQAMARGLSCPQCGGPIEIHAPGKTERVACPYCGSLLDAEHGLAVLEALSQAPQAPAIPLGSKGRIGAAVWTVVGFMVRSTDVDGIRFPWEEYLLYEVHHGFRWLVCSSGHWSFLEPVAPGQVEQRGLTATYKGGTYRHFESSQPRVDEVVGEFYWAVTRGTETQSDDYVQPPRLLSVETEGQGDASEVNVTEGYYLEASAIWTAFSLKGAAPETTGVAANQVSPHAPALGVTLGIAGLFLALLVLVFLGIAVTGNKTVFTEAITIPPGALSGAPEAAYITEPFEVQGRGNLAVTAATNVDNSWLYLEGALINEDTSGLDEFGLEASYYYGRDSDGAWSEGSPRATEYLGQIPAGHYRLRLAPQWEAGKVPGTYVLTVQRRVPRDYQLLVAVCLLLIWPFIVFVRYWNFEAARWSRSDHPGNNPFG